MHALSLLMYCTSINVKKVACLITHGRGVEWNVVYFVCIVSYCIGKIEFLDSCCLWKNEFALAVCLSWQKQTKYSFLLLCWLSPFHSVALWQCPLSHPMHTHFSYNTSIHFDILKRPFEVKNIWIPPLYAFNRAVFYRSKRMRLPTYLWKFPL